MAEAIGSDGEVADGYGCEHLGGNNEHVAGLVFELKELKEFGGKSKSACLVRDLCDVLLGI